MDLDVNTLGPKLIPRRGLRFEHNLLGPSITHMFKKLSSLFLLNPPTSLHIENGASKLAQSVGSDFFFLVTVMHGITRQVASSMQRVALTYCYFMMYGTSSTRSPVFESSTNQNLNSRNFCIHDLNKIYYDALKFFVKFSKRRPY